MAAQATTTQNAGQNPLGTKNNAPATSENADDSYDPHQHREVTNPTTNVETFIHLLKCSLGTGILAMPTAFKNSGLVVGVIITAFIGALCTCGLHILVKMQYRLCKQRQVPILSYPTTMQYSLEQGPDFLKCFAPISPYIVDGFLLVYQIGICCVYVVFIAENIKQVADQYWEPMDARVWMLILLVPLILINYIRNLKVMVPFSTLANVVTFIGLSIVLYYIFQDMPSIKDRDMIGTIFTFPLFFGTTVFALEAVGVIIALEKNMKTPHSFLGYFGVLNMGMTTITCIYILMGFFGYAKYGNDIEESITLNLPHTAIVAQTVKIMFAIAIFISHALQGYVPIMIVWNFYVEPYTPRNKLFWEYVVRTSITLTSFIFAIAVPRMGLFISLIGSLCLSALGFIFPVIIEMCVLWPDEWVLYRKLRCGILIIIGIMGLVTGTYVSLSEIVHSFVNESVHERQLSMRELYESRRY